MTFSDWVFDLDNTLYPASSSLFPQIHARMGLFIAERFGVTVEEAHRMQRQYYTHYGTTLRGLMELHEMAPDEFLAYVHDIDHGVLEPSPRLDAALGKIEGRKWVFTNGSARHAEKVLESLRLSHHFQGIFDIKAADYLPKPAIETYRKMLEQYAIDPHKSVMFEDLPQNLVAAAELGMTTVWVRQESHPDGPFGKDVPMGSIDHVTDDLAGWLESNLETRLE